jgi:GNAT superfamily N-acetyltransferase
VDLRVEPLTKDREGDFVALMARDSHGGAQCWCAAWWVPTWEAYIDNTPEDNRRLRDDLFKRGIHDGYLAYVEGAPIGWIQAGPRARLPKIAETLSLAPDAHAWAISCFIVLAPYRGQGLARRFLAAVLEDLRAKGVPAVEGYPLHGTGHEADDVWTGPESLFVEAGFTERSRGPNRAVYRLDLTA